MGDKGAHQPLKLLSLDGGGIRGLSSLIILQHLMKKINPETPPKPCDYFDLIGGTSTGGLIAIMLGRLCMDVPECIDKYLQLSALAFTPKRNKMNIVGKGKDLWTMSGKYRSESLVREFKAASEEVAGDAEALLYEPDGRCKVFVCTQSKALNTPVLLRSYTTTDSVDGLSTAGVKIWEAARATSAASTFFDPIRIGFQEFVDGATGRNNPVESVLAEANSLWADAASRIQCLVSIGTGKSEFRDFGNNLAEIKRTLVALATETEDTERRVYSNQENLGVGGRYFRFNVDRGLEGVVLDEHEKQATIVAATEAYLEDPRVNDLVTGFIQAKSPQHSLVTETDREKYLTWLPYLDPQANHNKARDLRTDKSTGEWFLRGKFQTWTSEPRSFMWLHAKAGSGKTVLSSTIIDTIQREHVAALAFFYFSIQNELVTLRQFKCSLIVQVLKSLIRPSSLVPRCYEAPLSFINLYRDYVPSTEPKMEDLDRVLLDLLELSGNAYIVVDALDECAPRELRSRVIDFLGLLSRLDRGNTHILVTSRREPDIEEAIKALPIPKDLVPFRVREVNRDIRNHLRTLLQLSAFTRWSEPLKQEVLHYLAEHADGVFRWADLQIQTLSRQEREKDVRKALRKLPKDLEATYEAILKRIQAEDKFEEALAILRWLAYSTRFLTLAEAAEVAAFEVDDVDVLPESDDFSVAFHPTNRFLEAPSIQRILAGLVTVDEKGKFSETRDVVIYFAHSSVSDYLHSSGVVPASFRLDFHNSHSFIFKSCIAYMVHCDEADAAKRKELPYPLMGYACQRAGKHLESLLQADNRKDWGRRRLPEPTGKLGKALTLYLRFAAGEHFLVQVFPRSGRPLDSLAFSFDHVQAALSTAAVAGEIELVKLILDSCPRHFANSATLAGRTPLQFAAVLGLSDVVSCFLQFGNVDVLAADYTGCTPLILASARGHTEVVRLLLSHQDIRSNDTDEEDRTALSWAAAGGHDEVVGLLLGHGHANPNAVDCRGRTALIWASSLGRTTVVTQLLGVTGIEPDRRDILGRTALSWAALRGHRDITSALLGRHDVTVNPIDNEGQDPDALARSRGHAILSTADAAESGVDSFDAPASSSDAPSTTLCSSWMTTGGKQAAINQLPDNLKTNETDVDIADFQAVEMGNHWHQVWHVVFSNDGRRLITCGNFDSAVIWSLACWTALFTLKGHRGPIIRAAWSPDDSMLITASIDKDARLWDSDNGTLLRTVGPYTGPCLTCIWTPDPESFILIGSSDESPDDSKNSSLIQTSVTGDESCVWASGFPCILWAVCNHSKWLLASDSFDTIHVYEIATKNLVHTIDTPPGLRHSAVCGSSTSSHVLVRFTDGSMALMDALSGESVQHFSDPEGGEAQYALGCSLGGPDESLAFGCGDDGTISVFCRETGKLVRRLREHKQPCNSVQWSPVDPRLFVSASDDGRVLIWTPQNNQPGVEIPPLDTRVKLLERLDISTRYAEFMEL